MSSNILGENIKALQTNRPSRSVDNEFKFILFDEIDKKEEKITTSIDKKMKQFIDKSYKTAIYHIVNDTDHKVLINKKKMIIKGREANPAEKISEKKGTMQFILEEINKKYNKNFTTFNDFIKYCEKLQPNDELKKINLYSHQKYKQLDNLIESCIDLLIEEIKKSTEDETYYKDFRNAYLHKINENPSKYVSIYNEYIRDNQIDVKTFGNSNSGVHSDVSIRIW